MSHYSVGVILKKDDVERLGLAFALEKALDPFDENLEVEEHPCNTLESLQSKLEEFRKVAETGESEIFNAKFIKELSEKGVLDSLESFIKNEYGYEDEDVRKTPEGIPYTTYNPNSKWDWYQVGGRWSDLIKNNTCLVRDIPMKKETSKEEVNEMETYYNAIITEDEDKTEAQKELLKESFFLYKPAYYREAYPVFKDYLDSHTSFSTYAILTADGKWIEPGKMGWFGMSASSPYNESHFHEVFRKTMEEASGEDVFVVVDCHI